MFQLGKISPWKFLGQDIGKLSASILGILFLQTMTQATEIPTVWITSFEPFSGRSRNGSEELARSFQSLWTDSFFTTDRGSVVKLRFYPVPVAYRRIDAVVQNIYETATQQGQSPVAILAMGEAGDSFRLETVAKNLDHTRSFDNERVRRLNFPINPRGPWELNTNFQFDKFMTESRNKFNLPLRLSDDAGTFLCNHLYYRLLELSVPSSPVVFLHVPIVDKMSNHDIGLMQENGIRIMRRLLNALIDS